MRCPQQAVFALRLVLLFVTLYASSAYAEDKPFVFEPVLRIDIGYADWSENFEPGIASVNLGKKRYEDGEFDSLGAGLWVAQEFGKDDEGNHTYRFNMDIFEKGHPNVFKNYQQPAGVPAYPSMGYTAKYTVKLGDVIMLPHGYLYKVRFMEEKMVEKGGVKDIPYIGVVLQRLKDDDPHYEGLNINRQHVYIPFGGGRLFRFGVRFRQGQIHPENSVERDAILCKVAPHYTTYLGNHESSAHYEIEIAGGRSNLPLFDVAFRVADIVVPNAETQLGGWVQIDPNPIPLVTDIPRPPYLRDAPKEPAKPNGPIKPIPEKSTVP